MVNPAIVLAIFEFVVLLFALSLHEAAHGWTAWRLGDPTARMLGRVTLNPAKHIDPMGTILLPVVALFLGLPLIGWAKPTPVTSRNFAHYKRDDMLVTLAGPASNVLAGIVSLLVLGVISAVSPAGKASVQSVAMQGLSGLNAQLMAISPVAYPLAEIFYIAMLWNLFLAAFNLLPLPPLDGSHIIRHWLPFKWQATFDRLGFISIFLMLFFGGRVAMGLISPVLGFFRVLLLSI